MIRIGVTKLGYADINRCSQDIADSVKAISVSAQDFANAYLKAALFMGFRTVEADLVTSAWNLKEPEGYAYAIVPLRRRDIEDENEYVVLLGDPKALESMPTAAEKSLVRATAGLVWKAQELVVETDGLELEPTPRKMAADELMHAARVVGACKGPFVADGEMVFSII